MIIYFRNMLSFFLLFFYRLQLTKKNTLEIGKSAVLFAKFKMNGNNNKMSFGSGCTLRKLNIEVSGNNNEISFADDVKVYESLKILIESNNCKINIEKGVTIGSAKIQCGEKNTKVTIGEDSMLSGEITINTSDFHSVIDINLKSRINPAKDVRIGKHVWIGSGVYINKGAFIDDDSIVAAKSVVPGKDFAKHSMIGGVPAKLIKSDVTWDRKII